MKEPDQQSELSPTHNLAPPAAGSAPASQHHLFEAHKPKKRTLGLKIFDVLLYPLLTNFGVFAISVFATYKTTYGNPNSWLRKRGDMLQRGFENIGMGPTTATMSKTVFFSFFDGTIFAPVIKLFEDRRERIGKWFDDKLGTTPEDLSVYDAEPKQTWGSVIWGRLATLLMVVPTATMLNKVMVTMPQKWDRSLIERTMVRDPKAIVGDKTNLNNYLFGFRGIIHGDKLAQTGFGQKLQRHFTSVPGLLFVGYFEAFYTTVCTAGQYLFSRAFARRHDQKIGRVERHQTVIVHPSKPANEVAAAVKEEPATTVSAAQAQARLADAPQPALNV